MNKYALLLILKKSKKKRGDRITDPPFFIFIHSAQAEIVTKLELSIAVFRISHGH